ncbi:hypothetical protein C9374_003631 [Naegleria lovaniensis]|uniref:TsaA-like domain-containing protein n=1 Tax=Naegleria lovaniensis TaxID=51637 RepID=A0AA88H7Y9_NAELO|nr:uncharacterized protein C9374_003631 [Naegleria lovaniensis]KAG2393867.1 hypothetical protein C9374_003631 [Naegleria lovaniensis]
MSSSPSATSSAIRKFFQFEVLGILESVFKQKTGCPRQSLIVPKARGRLALKFGGFTNNTQHFVEGLEGFSHVWLFWIFHQNNNLAEETTIIANTDTSSMEGNNNGMMSSSEVIKFKMMEKAKVRPPRLDGKKIGALSCRSPYRPNPMGMSVVKLDKITRDENNNAVLHLSGIDLVDQTPIIDIKPYIPEYDMVLQDPLSFPILKDLIMTYSDEIKKRKLEKETTEEQNTASSSSQEDSTQCKYFAKIADWMENMPRKQREITQVHFSEKSLQMIDTLIGKSTFYDNVDDAKELFEDLIKLDPRSKYRREKCQDELFGIHVDVFNLLCRVTDNVCTVEDIEDWSQGCPYSKEELKERTRQERNAVKEKKKKHKQSQENSESDNDPTE